MMKKFLSVCLCFSLLVFAFASCGKRAVYPLEIEGVGISKGVYAYYLDRVFSNPEKFGAKAGNRESILLKTEELCKKYAALTNYCKKLGVKPEQYIKSEANEKTDGLWSFFGEYYKRIGVCKADLLKVTLCESEKKQIVSFLFGKGGKSEVSQDDLKQSFVELYVGFKAIEAPLSKINTKGETTELSEKEKEALRAEFESMAKRLNNGTDIDTLNAEYCKKQNLVATQALQVNLAKKNDVMYDDGFFEEVSAIPHGSAAVVEGESTIYLIERETIATSDEDAFARYESEVLEYLKLPWVERKIASVAEKYKADGNEKIIDGIYKTVSENK